MNESGNKVTTQGIVNQQSSPSSFLVADWRVKPDTLRIFRADSEARLEPKVMQVLVYLAGKPPGQVISREELEANIWAAGWSAMTPLQIPSSNCARLSRMIRAIPESLRPYRKPGTG